MNPRRKALNESGNVLIAVLHRSRKEDSFATIRILRRAVVE